MFVNGRWKRLTKKIDEALDKKTADVANTPPVEPDATIVEEEKVDWNTPEGQRYLQNDAECTNCSHGSYCEHTERFFCMWLGIWREKHGVLPLFWQDAKKRYWMKATVRDGVPGYCCRHFYKSEGGGMAVLRGHDRLSFRVTNTGVYCDRCEERKGGDFYVTLKLSFKKVLSDNPDGSFTSQDKSVKMIDRFVCESCQREQSHGPRVVMSHSNIYIDEKMDDTIPLALFEERLEKTEQIFTMVPTVLLKRIMTAAAITEEKRHVALTE